MRRLEEEEDEEQEELTVLSQRTNMSENTLKLIKDKKKNQDIVKMRNEELLRGELI